MLPSSSRFGVLSRRTRWGFAPEATSGTHQPIRASVDEARAVPQMIWQSDHDLRNDDTVQYESTVVQLSQERMELAAQRLARGCRARLILSHSHAHYLHHRISQCNASQIEAPRNLYCLHWGKVERQLMCMTDGVTLYSCIFQFSHRNTVEQPNTQLEQLNVRTTENDHR